MVTIEGDVRLKEKMKNAYWRITPSKKISKMNKKDLFFVLLITAFYGVIALYRLGDFHIPSTWWENTKKEQKIELFFENTNLPITEMNFYIGRFGDKQCSVYESDDKVHWKKVMTKKEDQASYIKSSERFTMEGIYRWDKVKFKITKSYVRLVFHDKYTMLQEIVFRDKNGRIQTPDYEKQYHALFDEQELCKNVNGYETGTYFDEIYYVRTAYEMIHGLNWYETTHPPLGKIIIAIGIKIFGFCPFGWRIMGTLFGIAMLPVLYIFAKKLFGKTWAAVAATILFATDFMHFTQTRIATIDVYVTFFVLLMYFFLYQYMQMSFYDTPLKRTFVPLVGGGICMGLACACKWSGVYAAGGFVFLYFITIGKRILEYYYAKTCPDGSSHGILHRNVLETFGRKIKGTLLCFFIGCVCIPIVIYILTYIPFQDGENLGLIQRMLKNQSYIFNFHSTVELSHPFSSWYFDWPTMRTPVWYFNKTVSKGVQSNICAFGNPLIWWVGIAAFLYMIYISVRRKHRNAIFLCISYLAQFMPWAYIERGTFIYHYFPSVPFVILMIGYAMVQFTSTKKIKCKKMVYVLCGAYLLAVVGVFVMFYPVLSGYPVNAAYVEKYLCWLDSWTLMKQ